MVVMEAVPVDLVYVTLVGQDQHVTVKCHLKPVYRMSVETCVMGMETACADNADVMKDGLDIIVITVQRVLTHVTS